MGQKGITIEPDKYVVEDIEVLAFETEKDLNFYTLWHESLMDRRRELAAKSDREREVIRNEIARKTKHLIRLVGDEATTTTTAPSRSTKSSSKKSAKKRPSARHHQQPLKPPPAPAPTRTTLPTPQATATAASVTPATLVVPSPSPSPSPTKTAAASLAHAVAAASRQRQGSASLPNNLTIIGSTNFSKKFKLTKLYNKFRGRQIRRNFVNDKQLKTKIDLEVSKSYLNSWLAYTALQALRLPDSCHPPPATTTTTGSGKFRILASTNSQVPTTQPNMHLVYLDPCNTITYSNKINPQQVADYRQKSHLLPSIANSKKSSAASYDVYEIMEVLANTNKTNVTITRNANRPTQSSGSNTNSIYSHSVNANTPGIVSTQLHLQARFHLDMVAKFYAEEYERLDREAEELKQAPSDEEMISRYLKI